MSLLLAVAAVLAAIVSASATAVGFRAAGLASLGASFCLSSLNAVRFGPIRPSDAFLALAAGLLTLGYLIERPRPRRSLGVPIGFVVGCALFSAAGIVNAIAPSATPPGLRMAMAAGSDGSVSNVGQLLKFVVACAVLPLLLLIGRPSADECRVLAILWAVGPVISSIAAILDYLGLTRIGVGLRNVEDISGRSSGFATQQNHLAVSIVIVVPVLLACLSQHGRSKKWSGAGLLVLCCGQLASGSRGGLAGTALVTILGLMLIPSLAPLRRRLSVVGPIVALSVVALFYRLIPALLHALRFTSDTGRESDSIRAQLRTGAWHNFVRSPLFGVGYSQITGAHEVHLQILASAGLLGAVAYVAYFGSVIRGSRAARFVDSEFGAALTVSLLGWLALGFTENQIADRYLYPPVALLLGLRVLGARKLDFGHHRESDAERNGSASTGVRPRDVTEQS